MMHGQDYIAKARPLWQRTSEDVYEAKSLLSGDPLEINVWQV